jgi:hypothetical protein
MNQTERGCDPIYSLANEVGEEVWNVGRKVGTTSTGEAAKPEQPKLHI